MVTVNPARALRQENVLGRIKPGFQADLISIPCSGSANVFEEIIAFDQQVEWMMISGESTERYFAATKADSHFRFLFLKSEIFSAAEIFMAKIIIIDDEPAMVEVIVTLCREKGHQVFPFNSAPKAVEQMDSIQPQVVITDIKMETMTGFDVLRHVREHHRQTAVILITAYGTVETAVEAMKMGAYDYVTKPFKIDELQMTIQRALDYQAALRENVYLRKELKNRYRFENIIGTSRKMQHVYNLINKVADTDSTVLIVGESGTGKELVARGLHFNSNRQHHPFVAINCSALPENLLESELFGHKKGAFTGAVADKRGLFEEANLGTIFLDEVNSMAPPLQTKLLAGSAGTRGAAGGRQQEFARQCARGGRDERSVVAKTQGRNVSRRSLLPTGGDPD